jgi:hypothetical protein
MKQSDIDLLKQQALDQGALMRQETRQVVHNEEIVLQTAFNEGYTDPVVGRVLPPYKGDCKCDVLFLLPFPSEAALTETVSDSRRWCILDKEITLLNMAISFASPDIYNQLKDNYAVAAAIPFRSKGNARHVKASKAYLESLIKRVDPKVIVCMGKTGFDMLSTVKLRKNDSVGGLFDVAGHPGKVMCLTESMASLSNKPDKWERFSLDIIVVSRHLNYLAPGVSQGTPNPSLYVVRNSNELEYMLQHFERRGSTIFSVDCEWGRDPERPDLPVTFVDGKLRSIQFSDDAESGYYVRFRDADERYVFDISYEEVGKRMKRFFDRSHIKYIGHNLAADFVWMRGVLGLEVYGKAAWDTLFAQQTLDEAAPLKLEMLALQYTSLGRYDVDLTVWKTQHKKEVEDTGYARVPDKILIPYAIKDVITVFRAYPVQRRHLQEDNLEPYFLNYCLPFVTDAFTHMSYHGLPILKEELDTVRNLLVSTEAHYYRDFKEDMQQLSFETLENYIYKYTDPESHAYMHSQISLWLTLSPRQVREQVATWFSTLCTAPKSDLAVYNRAIQLAGFALACLYNPENPRSGFNARSTPMMREWLFDIAGHTPIKTVKFENVQLSWKARENLPDSRKKDYPPSTDKASLSVFALTDKTVDKLLAINAIGNLVKAFLKQPTPEGKEQGLHKWIASNGCIHSNFMRTESGRPRSFNPNILNIPKEVARPIEDAIRTFHRTSIDSIRSCSGVAPESGWCMVDSDLQTAELVALAVISGDDEMLKACTGEDTGFALLRSADGGDPKPVRIGWDDCSRHIHESAQDSSVLYNGSDSDLLRSEEGILLHPRRDMHWELAEAFMRQPREFLKKSIHRNALAKPANFSCSYGATAGLLERRYKEITGSDPEKGMGQKVIDAWEAKNSIASAYLRARGDILGGPPPCTDLGIAGMRRIFRKPIYLGSKPYSQFTDEERKSVSGLYREARNFPMQNSVAETTAKGLRLCIEASRQLGLQAYHPQLLYDALTSVCPLRERFVVREMHQRFLGSMFNTWNINGRSLSFGVETQISYRMEHTPTEEQRAFLYTPGKDDLDPEKVLSAFRVPDSFAV